MNRPHWVACVLALVLLSCDSFRASPAHNEAPSPPAATPMKDIAPAVLATDRAAVRGLAPGRNESGSDLGNPLTDPTVLSTMIIRTGQASVEVDSLEAAVEQARRLAQSVGGYIANTTLQAGRDQVRTATLEIKVPASRFDDAITGLRPLGKLESVNVTAEDVGEEFTDVTARVANARRLEQRLIDLLATRTGKLQDVLEVERELARVREEIERYEGRLRYLKTRAAVSTLSVTVHEKSPILDRTGSNPIVEALRQAWRNFVAFCAGLIASLGTLVPIAGLLVLGIVLIKRLWRAGRQVIGDRW